MGHHQVEIELGAGYTDPHIQKVYASMSDLTKMMENPKLLRSSPPVYLAQYDMRDMPELKADYLYPDLTRTGKASVYKINLWLGFEDTFSPCHYDPYHNVLCQITGSKTVILFNPAYSKNLYPHEKDIRLKNTSQIRDILGNVDSTTFPLFHECFGLKAVLEPGDAVYIPFKWWHFCKANSINTSLNFWWL